MRMQQSVMMMMMMTMMMMMAMMAMMVMVMITMMITPGIRTSNLAPTILVDLHKGCSAETGLNLITVETVKIARMMTLMMATMMMTKITLF